MRHFHGHGAEASHADGDEDPTAGAAGAVARAELATADQEASSAFRRGSCAFVAANCTTTTAAAAHCDYSSGRAWFCSVLILVDLQHAAAAYMGAGQDTGLGVSPIPVAIFSVGIVGAVYGGPKAAAAVDLAYADLDSSDAADSGRTRGSARSGGCVRNQALCSKGPPGRHSSLPVLSLRENQVPQALLHVLPERPAVHQCVRVPGFYVGFDGIFTVDYHLVDPL